MNESQHSENFVTNFVKGVGNTITAAVNPTPAQDAFVYNPEKVKTNIEKQEAFVEPPNIIKILRSRKPLNVIAPSIDTNIIPNQMLDEARQYYALTQDIDDLDYTRKNEPDYFNAIQKSYDGLNKALFTATNKARSEVPKVAIPFWNSQTGSPEDQTKFLFAHRPEARLAINRKNLDNHLLGMGLEDKVDLRKILRDGFTTGNMFLELKERQAQIGRAGLSASALILQNAYDFADSIITGGTDLSASFNNYKQKSVKRTQDRKLFLQQMADSGWLSGQAEAFNAWVKEQYLKTNSEAAYVANEDDLILSPEQVKSIYDYSFGDLNAAESLAVFLAENASTAVGFSVAGRAVRGVGSFLNKDLNPTSYYLKADRLRKSFTKDGIKPFMYASTTDFIESKVVNETRKFNLTNLFYKLTLPASRLSARAEAGGEAVRPVIDLPKFKSLRTKVDKANINYNKAKASTTLDKRAVDLAEEQLINAENELATAIMYHNLGSRRFMFALTGYSGSQLKRLFGDEALPALVQNTTYELVYRALGNTSESQDVADITGAGANIFAMLSQQKVPFFSQVGKITRAGTGFFTKPIIENPTFAFAKFLNGTRLVQAIGGPDALLRSDIMKLRIRERPGLYGKFDKTAYDANGKALYKYRTPNAEDYASLKRQQDWYGRLSLETQELIYENAQNMSRGIDNAVRIVKDDKLREQLRSQLELSFSQTSQIIFFEAKGQQTMNHLVNRDIEKITPDFKKSVEYFLDSQRMLAAQADVLKTIEDLVARALPDVDNAGDATVLKSIPAIRATVFAHQENILNTQKSILKQAHKEIVEMMNDSSQFMRLTPDQRNETMDSLLDSLILLDEGTLPNRQAIEDVVGGIFQLRDSAKRHMDAADLVFENALDGMQKGMSNAHAVLEGAKRINKDEVIRLISDGKELMTHQFQLKNTALYSSLGEFGKVSKVDVFDTILDIEKMNDAKLSRFIIKGTHEGFHGADFTKSMQIAAKDAVFEYARKRVNPEGVDEFGETITKTAEQIDAEARQIAAQFKVDFRKELELRYSLTASDFAFGRVTDVHVYDLFKNGGFTATDYAGNPIIMGDVSIGFEDLEYMHRYLKDRAFSLKDTQPQIANDYRDAANKLDEFLLNSPEALKPIKLADGTESTVGTEIRIRRLRHEIEVAGRKEKGTFFGNFAQQMLYPHYGKRPMVSGTGRRLKGGVLEGEAKLLQTAGGHDFLKAIFSSDGQARVDAARSFSDGLQVEFGEPVYPSQYVDANTGNLRRDIDFNEVIGTNETTGLPITIADDIRENTKYVIDPNTKQGELAIKKARYVAALLLQEMSLYKKVFKDIEKTLDDPDKFFGNSIFNKANAGRLAPTDSPFDSMLTGTVVDKDEDGISLFYKIQEALTIDVSGSFVGRTPEFGEIDPVSGNLLSGARTTANPEQIPLINLDDWLKVETSLDDVLATSEKAVEEYNTIIRNFNKEADRIEINTTLKLEKEAKIRTEIFDYFEVDSGASLIQKYVRNIPQGESRNVGNITMVKGWEDALAVTQQANPDVPAEEIKKVWASILMDGIIGAGKPKSEMISGQGVNMVMESPAEAFALLETKTIKDMFAAVDVDEEHYEALLGILGHMVVVDSYYTKGAAVGGLPQKGYTDEGLMARAFNYARGMVGGHYLAVEAGFKVMRQHDMGMLDWMLNDKDAAKYLFDVMEGKVEVNRFNASTFFDRMGGWIVRNLISRGERLKEYPGVEQALDIVTTEEEEEED